MECNISRQKTISEYLQSPEIWRENLLAATTSIDQFSITMLFRILVDVIMLAWAYLPSIESLARSLMHRSLDLQWVKWVERVRRCGWRPREWFLLCRMKRDHYEKLAKGHLWKSVDSDKNHSLYIINVINHVGKDLNVCGQRNIRWKRKYHERCPDTRYRSNPPRITAGTFVHLKPDETWRQYHIRMNPSSKSKPACFGDHIQRSNQWQNRESLRRQGLRSWGRNGSNAFRSSSA